jgi:RNA recognition motif. (a.k.a. RRM, RBD, or RNP domain)
MFVAFKMSVSFCSFRILVDVVCAVTSEEFYRYFLRHGSILDSVVMFDKATQRCRGFGFVTFEDPQVCTDLLKLGGADEATSFDEAATGPQNGHLEMRGKIIEIKRAQPKTSLPGGSPGSDKSSTHSAASHDRRRSGNAKSSQQHLPLENDSYHGYQTDGMTHDSHMSYEHQNMQHRSFLRPYIPATPMACYTDPGNQLTPQQAVLDLAHHMLFYSQLLATPSLMQHHLGMVSPMLSPGMMGVQAYGNYFQPFYDENATHGCPSPVPLVSRLRKVPEGESFELGGGKFFRETPLLDSSKSRPSLQPAMDEKR